MRRENLATKLIATTVGVAFTTLGSNAIATAADSGFSVSGSFGDTVVNTFFGNRENTVYSTFSGTYSYSASAPDLEESDLFGLYSLSDFDIEVFGDNTLLVSISPSNGWTGFITVDPEPEPIPLIGLSFLNSTLSESFQLNFPGLSDDDSLPTVALGTTFAESPGYYRVQTDFPEPGTNDFYLVSSGTSVPEPSSFVGLSLLGLGLLLKRAFPGSK
ncbi:MAG: PEP-CTERM sorting domain-containing protein [Leptolyngbyaceae cyanobacterium bins.59]|nr:PEP-CTERM sorting domain-containing protein [Leptolyngbyaceae cyanobacterium bins.59]